MLLTIDVGNTNISMGILDEEKIVGRYRLMTQTTRTSDEYGFFITTFLKYITVKKAADITGIIISSVVPKLMYSLTSAVIKYLHQKTNDCNKMRCKWISNLIQRHLGQLVQTVL